MMKNILLIIMTAAMSSSLVAEETKSSDKPEGRIYVYKGEANKAREIEIFFPEGHDPAKKAVPAIIMFHGGAWHGGGRKQFSDLCHYFSTRGIVAATVTYKLAKKGGAKGAKSNESKKRVCITDAKSAIRWYKKNAKKLGIDPNKIIGGGGSAGGHICMLATTNPGLDDPKDPKEFDTSVAAYLLFNPALSASDSSDPEVDVVHHLKADFAPAIVFFGSEDKWFKKGWKAATKKIAELKLNDSIKVRIADGQGHSFFNNQPWADVTYMESDKFLKSLGYLEGEPTLKDPTTGEKLRDGK